MAALRAKIEERERGEGGGAVPASTSCLLPRVDARRPEPTRGLCFHPNFHFLVFLINFLFFKKN